METSGVGSLSGRSPVLCLSLSVSAARQRQGAPQIKPISTWLGPLSPPRTSYQRPFTLTKGLMNCILCVCRTPRSSLTKETLGGLFLTGGPLRIVLQSGAPLKSCHMEM